MAHPHTERDPRSTALGYLARGWAPIPVKPQSKHPVGEGWQNQRLTADDIGRKFDARANIGVLLGAPSGWLVDVDLDSDEAIALADKYLPPTPAVFGKESTPGAHRLYVAEGARSDKYAMKDASGGSVTFVELRAHSHTVFPGSIHVSGQAIEWQSDGKPSVVTRELIEARVRKLGAVSALVANGYPLEAADRIADDHAAVTQLAGPLGDALRKWLGIKPKAEPAPRKPATYDRDGAVDQYNREHAYKWPKAGKGTCPICKHNDCFGALGNEGKAFCFSTSHTEGGYSTDKGWLISPLDVDAHGAGFRDVGEFLRDRGYLARPRVGLSSFQGFAQPEEQPSEEPQKPHRLAALTSAEVLNEWKNAKEPAFVATTIEALDAAIGGGLPAGQVTTLLGYTGAGKSELARQVLLRVSGNGTPVIHVDVELGARRVVERHLSQTTKIPSAILRQRESLSATEMERVDGAIEVLSRHPVLTISPGGGVPLGDLDRAIVDALARAKEQAPDKVPLVILDSAQRLAVGAEGKDTRLQNQNFMWWLSSMAQHHGFAVLLTSEQKRMEGGRPTPDQALSSGAETRAIEFQSDVVLALVPQDKAEDDTATSATSEWERRVSLLIAKTREGRVGYVPTDLMFTGPCWGMRVDKREDELELRIIEMLEAGGVHSAGDIQKATKKNNQLVRKKLREMAASGAVEFVSNGPMSGYRLPLPKTRNGSSPSETQNGYGISGRGSST